MILSSTEEKMPWENNADTKIFSKNTFDVILETNTDYKIYPTIRADDDTFYYRRQHSTNHNRYPNLLPNARDAILTNYTHHNSQ